MIDDLTKVKERIKIYMNIAKAASELSRDFSKIGCVAIYRNRIVSIGVNGYISGYDDTESAGKHAKVIHAEMNAILTAKQPIDVLVVYGLPPCQCCMKFMIAYGVKKCYWQLDESIVSHPHWMKNHTDHSRWHNKDIFERIQ